MPINYKAGINTTILFWNNPQTVNTDIQHAHITNATLQYVAEPVGGTEPIELTAIGPDNKCYHAKYNSDTSQCTYSCAANVPCPKCDCGGAGGLFVGLPLALPVGQCYGDGTLYSVTLPISGGSIGLHYCFSSNSPVYFIEQFTPSGSSAEASEHPFSKEVSQYEAPQADMAKADRLQEFFESHHERRMAEVGANAADDDNPSKIREILMIFKTFDITITPKELFYPPKYCTTCNPLLE